MDYNRKFLASVSTVSELTRFSYAVSNPKWHAAVKYEINALENNVTWEMTPLTWGKIALGSKWLYKIKYKADGTIGSFKARLVILGNTQQEGVDFTETFPPVSKMVTIRTFFLVATARN